MSIQNVHINPCSEPLLFNQLGFIVIGLLMCFIIVSPEFSKKVSVGGPKTSCQYINMFLDYIA